MIKTLFIKTKMNLPMQRAASWERVWNTDEGMGENEMSKELSKSTGSVLNYRAASYLRSFRTLYRRGELKNGWGELSAMDSLKKWKAERFHWDRGVKGGWRGGEHTQDSEKPS